MKLRPTVLAPLLLLVALTQSARAVIYDPWDLYDAQLKALFAGDGCVRVRAGVASATPPHVIRIDVCEASEAQALATLLRPLPASGAEIQVFGPRQTQVSPGPIPDTPRGWKQLFDSGFGNNCFYLRSFRGEVLGRDVAFVDIANTTIQVYADNPADPNGNVTMLAALFFFDALIPSNGYQLFSSADYVSACGGNAKRGS